MQAEIWHKPRTLLTELEDWNRTEGLFDNLFGKDSLGDRDFQKMKLGEFDKLFHSYNGRKDLSTDERSLMRMLAFQRKKLRRLLYPGLLRRMIYRLAEFIAFSVMDSRKLADNEAGRYDRMIQIPTDEARLRVDGQPAGRYQPRHRHGQDLGRKRQQANQKKRGHSI